MKDTLKFLEMMEKAMPTEMDHHTLKLTTGGLLEVILFDEEKETYLPFILEPEDLEKPPEQLAAELIEMIKGRI